MADNARDLGAVFDEHMRCEFVLRDVEATMRTMSASPHLTHVPTLTGGVGGGLTAGATQPGDSRRQVRLTASLRLREKPTDANGMFQESIS
jgi:hypothetical protein